MNNSGKNLGNGKVFKFTVDGKHYSSEIETISGKQIKAIAGLSENTELYRPNKKSGEDELIENDRNINLDQPGIEDFITKQQSTYTFFIDKKEYTTAKQFISVKAILEDYAKVSTVANTLAEKQQGTFHEYKNLDELIDLTKVRRFTLFNNTPAGVS